MSATFVFARVHLQGLEGGAMEFVWVPRRMKDQIEDRRFFATA